jgi:hypothetical protein
MMIPVNEVVQGLLPGGQLVRLMMAGEAQASSHRRTPGSSILQQLCDTSGKGLLVSVPSK